MTALPLGGYTKIAGMEGDPYNPYLEQVLALLTEAHEPFTNDEVQEQLNLTPDDAEDALHTLVDWAALTYDASTETWSSVYTPTEAEDSKALLERAKKHTYVSLNLGKRILVLLGGILVNIIFALLLVTLLLTLWGQAQYRGKISPVADGPAAEAGLKKNDVITRIGTHPIHEFQDITAATSGYKVGDTLTVTYRRIKGKVSSERITKLTLARAPSGSGLSTYIGVEAVPEQVRLPLGKALGEALNYLKLVVQSILGFFTPGKFSESVKNSSSVIGIAVISAQAAKSGLIDYVSLIAAISLSLGLMNLLPIPPLDGGKIVIEIVQAIRRKPFTQKVNFIVSVAGLSLLVLFMIIVMKNDILRLIGT